MCGTFSLGLGRGGKRKLGWVGVPDGWMDGQANRGRGTKWGVYCAWVGHVRTRRIFIFLGGAALIDVRFLVSARGYYISILAKRGSCCV